MRYQSAPMLSTLSLVGENSAPNGRMIDGWEQYLSCEPQDWLLKWRSLCGTVSCLFSYQDLIWEPSIGRWLLMGLRYTGAKDAR